MPRYEIRNKVTRTVLREVTVEYDEDVLPALALATQSTVEEIAQSLGSTVEKAKAALQIVLLPDPQPVRATTSGKAKLAACLPPRQLYR